jgi:ABC-2 type transport system permease protein
MAKNLLIKIIRGLFDLVRIGCDELKNIFRDEGVIVIFFGASLLYPILYSSIYKNEAFRKASIGIVDESNTSTSREFIRKMDATPEVAVNYKCTTVEEAKKLYDDRKILGFVLIPKDFSNNIHTGKQAHVSVYTNMSSMMYYKSLYTASNYVCLSMGHDIQSHNLYAKGYSVKQVDATVSPIPSEGIALYNPQNGFSSYFLPPVLILIIQQTLVLGIGILAGTAREENRFHQLIPMQRRYHGSLRIVLGKSIAYLLIYSFVAAFDLLLIPTMFNLPQLGNSKDLILFLLPYLLSVIFFAITISVFFRNRESPFLIFLFTSLIFLFMSGYSWPATHIHPVWKAISYLIPSTFGIAGFLKINSMGATIEQARFEYFALWLQVCCYFISSCLVYRWQIMQSEKKRLCDFSA